MKVKSLERFILKKKVYFGLVTNDEIIKKKISTQISQYCYKLLILNRGEQPHIPLPKANTLGCTGPPTHPTNQLSGRMCQ